MKHVLLECSTDYLAATQGFNFHPTLDKAAEGLKQVLTYPTYFSNLQRNL